MVLAFPAGAQSAADLRTLFFQHDFEGGYRAGLAAPQTAKTPEFLAWFVANEARYGLADEALAAADSIPKTSLWRVFARVVALAEGPDDYQAIALGHALATRGSPEPDFLWAYAFALFTHQRGAAAVAALDSGQLRGVPESAELYALEGAALSQVAFFLPGDSATWDRAEAAFAAARRLDSTNVDADYFQAIYDRRGMSDTGDIAALARAAAHAPYAAGIHSDYWQALIRAHRPQTAVIDDIAGLLGRRDAAASALFHAADGYDLLGDTSRAQALHDRLLREHPESPFADYLRMQRVRKAKDTVSVYRARLSAFVEPSTHHESLMRGAAYFELFASEAHDSTVSSAEVLRNVQGMVRYNNANPQWLYVFAPLTLADRRIALRYAEGLARGGDSIFHRDFAPRFDRLNPLQRAQEWARLTGEERDALGWVYFNEGRIADARRLLTEAKSADSANPLVYYHMGRVAEADGRRRLAQQRYVTGHQMELINHGFDGTRNGDALRRLFAARGGAPPDFAAYVDSLSVEDRRRRRAMVAASRLRTPALVPAFHLTRLGSDSTVTSDAVRGKIVVLHFWGAWCAECVAEMPEFARWYESIRQDTSVVVLAVDYLDEPPAAEQFVARRHLSFPILVDNAYVERIGIRGFPTTWFLDRTGRLAFVREGWSGSLAEEFSWRVDLLR